MAFPHQLYKDLDSRRPPDFLKERPGLVHGLQQWAIHRERLAVPEIVDLLSEPLLQRWKRFPGVSKKPGKRWGKRGKKKWGNGFQTMSIAFL